MSSLRPSIALAALTSLAAASCTHSGPPVLYGVTQGEAASDASPPKPEHDAAASHVPDDIVARVAMPYHGFRVRDHAVLTPEQLYDDLIRVDAVCIGEEHDNPHDHYAELQVVHELTTRASMHGRQIGVGFEMFQRPYQRALDDYANGRSDERKLLSASQYQKRWGWPFAYYRPVLDLARSEGVALVALNATQEQSHAVATGGLNALSDSDRTKLGDVDLEDAEHRARFDELMRDHPTKGKTAQHLYEAQVLWDEAMAGAATSWLRAGRPARLMVILAGDAHCARPAIPRRIERRMAGRSVAVRPVLSKAHADLAQEVDGFDYAVIMTSDDG